MNDKELNFILQEGEGLKIEFKESLDHIAKEIVAFANTEGGRIFVGITDNNKIKGVDVTNKLRSELQDIARNCDPHVIIELESFNNILIVHVKEGTNKPYKCSSGFYLREGANSQKLSRDEIVKLVTGLGRVKFDEQINEAFDFSKNFNEKKFSEFLRKSNISKVISTKEILANLSLGAFIKKKFKLNNAGILFFAKEPEKFFRHNFITCVLYKGKERLNIIDRKDFKNDLLTNYDNGIGFLKQHLKVQYIIKGAGPRKEVLELPEEALRESLLNAIAHRDYFEEGFGIFVEIFDDRVEITNRGKLLFDKKKLGKISFPRNPILFDVFYRLGLIEKVGSGINRIKDLVKEMGLKVKFEVDDFFRIMFYRRGAMDLENVPLNVLLNVPLNKRQENIIKIISAEKVNSAILAQQLHVNRKTVQRDINLLLDNKLIKRIGSKKTGYYCLDDGVEHLIKRSLKESQKGGK